MEGKPFELVAINIDDREKSVREMVKEMNLSFPILRDPGSKIARVWGAITLPQTFIIGPDGVLRDKFLGKKDWASENMIERLDKLMPASKP